jgi:hypothetical protein
MSTVPKVHISALSALKAVDIVENLHSSISSKTFISSNCSLSGKPLPELSVTDVPSLVSNNPSTSDVFTQFGTALHSNIGSSSSSMSLRTIYPEFGDCQSMADVVHLSAELAPCSFDIVKAQAAHRLDPKSLNSDILQADLLYAQTYGLQSLLTTRFHDAERITLQPAIVSSDFKSVFTFRNLHSVAVNGVTTATHSSFAPNLGVNCPTYPIDIADPEILIDHLQKLHSSGQFILLPMHLISSLAAAEHLSYHVSPLFIAKKAGKPLGRLVFNFSHDGPNHPENKERLSQQYGHITPPQLGNVCQLIENAHILFPNSGDILEAIRRDIEGAFHHLRYSWESSLLCMGQIVINNLVYGVISSVAVMGDQTVNYSFNQVSLAIDETLQTYVSSLTGSQLPLSTVATDDIIAIGPPTLIDSVHDQIGLLVGDGRRPGLCSSESAIKPEKDLRGQCIVILGWLFDVPHRMVWPNYLTFAKLVYCMFILPGPTPLPGQPILVGDLMLMGAHAMRSSNIIVALLSFSRGFLANIRGSSNPKAIVFLTRRTCFDITMWRLLLTMSFTDARVLRCSTASPLLRMRLPSDDTSESRDTRSIRAARLLSYSDACTGENHVFPGVGGYIPGYGWFGHRYESLRYMRVKGLLMDTPINVLELLALVVTAALTIQIHVQQYGSARGCHFHVFCDNISAVAKARTHRSDHPIYSYLLFLLSHIQLHYGCTIGSSYLAGILNTIADATSRCFEVPHGREIYLRYLRNLQRFQPLPLCIEDISLILLSSNSYVSSPLQPRPMRLEPITSAGFLLSKV